VTPTPYCSLSISCEPLGVADEEGSLVEYKVIASNAGNQAAVGVVVTVTVDSHFEIVEVTRTQGEVTVDGQVVTVDVGVMGTEPGFHVEVVVRCRVRSDVGEDVDIGNVASAAVTSHNCGDQRAICGWVLPVTGTRGRPQRNLWIAAVGLTIVVAIGVWEGIRLRRRNRAS
jgi:uncharacterized repeat protein (TIGR01451 family)